MTIVDTLADEHYGDRARLAMEFARLLNEEARELAAAGVNVVQFDEPAFNVYLDDVRAWGIEALHRASDGVAATTAVHICYGYGIPANVQWKATLGREWRQYEAIFPLLAQSRIQQVSLECANSRVPLELLRLLTGKDVLLGAVDVATDEVESPAQVAETIRAALAHIKPARLFPCTNCGMVPLGREVASAKLRALVEGARVVRGEIGQPSSLAPCPTPGATSTTSPWARNTNRRAARSPRATSCSSPGSPAISTSCTPTRNS
jgi:5-methyltetrahydropteroyltriglutamate--homocysteine methyltransferase